MVSIKCALVILVAIAIVESQTNIILRSMPDENAKVCPGDEIIFTCETTGSSILAWSSNEYIGGGGLQLDFTFSETPGRVSRSSINPDVIATLTSASDQPRIISSTLRILALSGISSFSVFCIHRTDQRNESIRFEYLGKPGPPSGLTAIEIKEGNACVIAVSWNHPNGIEESDVNHYEITSSATNRTINATSLVNFLIEVPDCGVEISIRLRAVSRCLEVGNYTGEVPATLLNLDDERVNVATGTAPSGPILDNEGQLGVGAAVGITVGVILPIFFLGVVLVVFIIYCMYVRRKERKDIQQSNDETDMKPLISQIRETQQEQDQRINQLMSQLSSEQNTLKEQQTKVTQIQETQQEQDQRVNQLTSQQTKMTEEMTQLERKNRVTQLEGQVNKLRSELSSTQEELNALKQPQEMERVTQLEGHVTKLKKQLSSTMKELEALKQEQTKIKSKLNEDLQESSRFTIPSASHQPGIMAYSQVGYPASSASGVLRRN